MGVTSQMEEDPTTGVFRVKPHLTNFTSFTNHFNKQIFEDSRERSVLQPHYNYMRKVTIPYSNTRHPEDGVCVHFLKKGIIRGGDRALVKMTSACWSNGGRKLVCGLENGYY